jgi:hypothetical protein
LSAHLEGENGGGGTRRGRGVLQCDDGAVDSSETAESMVFVAIVLCMTRVMGNGYICGYSLSAYGYDFLSVTDNRYRFRYIIKDTDINI